MNSINLIGRTTKEIELKYTPSDKAYIRFTLAVNRSFANANGEYDADFISCVAWDKKAENLAKYVKKGHRIGVEGRIQTSTYDKDDGSTGYSTDVVINNFDFLEMKPKDDRPEPDYIGPVEEKEETDSFAEFGEQLVELSDDFLE